MNNGSDEALVKEPIAPNKTNDRKNMTETYGEEETNETKPNPMAKHKRKRKKSRISRPTDPDLDADPNSSVDSTPIQMTVIPGQSAIQSKAPSPSEVKNPIVVEVGKVGKARPVLVLSPQDRRLLCITLNLICVLTVASLTIAVSSVFRDESNLAMERSSYWWYFIFMSLMSIYLCAAFSLLNCNLDGLSLMGISFFSAILAVIELITMTRFFFVTFPFPDIKYESGQWIEPFVIIGLSIVRFFALIVSLICFTKYWSKNTNKTTTDESDVENTISHSGGQTRS